LSKKVVILKPYDTAEWEKRAYSEIAEVRDTKCLTEDKLIEEIREVDILIADVDITVSGPVLEAAKNLCGIVCCSTGVDYIDIETATQRGIYVTKVGDYCTRAVAEHTIGLMLSFARKINLAEKAVKAGKWEEWRQFEGFELEGKTLGIIGIGKIGRAVAEKAIALGMNIIAYDPYVDKEIIEAKGIRMVKLHLLLRESDIISLHMPITEKNRKLIGREEFGVMKKSVCLINTSRGALIDQKVLYDVLKNKKIAGAAVDVLEKEPPDANDPLLKLDNLIVTPHIGWNTKEAKERERKGEKEEVFRLIKGQVPKNLINKEVVSSRYKRGL